MQETLIARFDEMVWILPVLMRCVSQGLSDPSPDSRAVPMNKN